MKNNKKGFTLAELLIVVAIIGVLVAISIPIFTSQLEKAREATDLANIRSAYALGQTTALTGTYGDSATPIDTTKTYHYDAAAGSLVDAAPTTNWFKGTATGSGTQTVAGTLTYDSSKAYTDMTITFAGTSAPYTVTYALVASGS